jgi:hypothetical protein
VGSVAAAEPFDVRVKTLHRQSFLAPDSLRSTTVVSPPPHHITHTATSTTPDHPRV